ncbi:MAG TPA: hypothetical protein VJQ56_09480 [Blastocatellia bacterium]|nr:hypothetical protein [Blastocatellia bacterium]
MKAGKPFTYLLLVALAAIVLFAPNVTTGQAQGPACDVVVITEDDVVRQAENTPPTNNWVLYTRNAGNGVFRVGPGQPPLGVGSFETLTPTGADKVTLFNFDHVGTPLSEIDRLGYATYRAANEADNDAQLPAINIQVDINGDAPGGFTTLVFEPVYNTTQGAIEDNTWQTWDAFNGGQAIWWSSNPIPGAPNRDTFVTWDTIVNLNPDAVILGGFGINQGSGNPALTASTDALTIGYGDECVTYNFDPFEVAASKDACKNGGWKTLRRADGSAFKNQGDCIQYVNTGK